jgi:hypothetical protein
VGAIPEVLPKVIENHKVFAHQHGYDYLFFDESRIQDVQQLVEGPGDATWIKPEVILATLPDYDYVFWTDLDSVFHDEKKSLSDLIGLNKSFVFTGDQNDVLNTGHLLFRNDEFSSRLINAWRIFQTLPFPALGTTQQGPHGHVNDQIAMNVLIAGGRPTASEVSQNGARLFNQTNGWPGNNDRINQDFGERYAPNRRRNLHRTRSLLAPELREHVDIVVQHRLNAYPWWGPKGRKNRRGPIIHFVSPYKHLLDAYFS